MIRLIPRIRQLTMIVPMLLLLLIPSSGLAQSATTPPWWVETSEARQVVNVVVGNNALRTELVLTSDEQALGLGYRNGLESDSAMLFVNDDASPRSFWMKGMRFCLDIIWIENGIIVGAAENTCPDPEGTADADRLRVTSPSPVTYVLEVNAGWLADRGYGVGTTVTIPEVPAA